MPRNYIRKTERGSWTKETMEEAVNLVRSGAFTGFEVALRYSIPRSTLMDHVSGRRGRKSQSMGKPMALPKTVEEKVAENLKYMETYGFKFTKKDILELVGDYLKVCEIPSPFKSGYPGDDWIVSFANRNGLKRPQAEKKEFAEFKVYFTILKGIIEKYYLKDAPGKIWCFDETGFNFTGQEIKITNKMKETNVTVLTACNAEGQKAPVLIVFKDKSETHHFIANDKARYAVTENGWLNKNEFRDYFTKTFLSHIRNLPPILIAFNGRSSQIDIQLIEEVKRANIMFLKIPKLLNGHSVLNSLKHKLEIDLSNLKSNEIGEQFCDVVVSDFEKFNTDDIKNGFMKAGIHPYDESVTEDKYDADFIQKWTEYELSLKNDEASKENKALDSVLVNETSAQQPVEEETADSFLPQYKEQDTVVDGKKNQLHSTKSSGCLVEYGGLTNTSSTSVPMTEACTQTPAKLKRKAPRSEDSKLRKILMDKPITHRDPGYGAIIEAARTIQEPCTVCCVFGCRINVRINPDKGFFPFPTQPERYLNWLKLINRGDLVDKLSSGNTDHRVCSDHFDGGDFNGDALKEEAIPHLMLPKKSDNVEYVNCGDDMDEIIKIEMPDESDETEVEIHYQPEEPPPATFTRPVIPLIPHVECQNVSIPPIPMIIENDEIPAFQINKNLFNPKSVEVQSIKIEKVEVPAVPVNKYQHYTKPANVPLKTRMAFLKNATISCVEHVSLPIEETIEKKSVVVQTTKDLIDKMNLPMKKKYENQIREANARLNQLGKDCNNPRMDQNKFLESCDKYLDEKIANIVKSHASLLEKSKGNRYSQNFKVFALNLYLCSPQSYKFVEQFFYLPSMTTIHRLQTPVRTGFNENLIQSFKVKIDQMSEKEKMCTVCFDYMDVNKNLYYDVRHDLICGLHEIDQAQGTEPARYAPVIMTRGLYSKWKQPVAFALVAEKKCYPELKQWLYKTIALLFDLGLNVKAFTANQETEFLDFSDISVSESFFEVCGRKIYQIFDAPFLMKSARDDFMRYEFHFGKKVAKLSHVLEVYDADKQQDLKLMPKITDQHLRPVEESENDLKLSIELFSRAVAAAMNFHVITKMVHKKTNDTVEFIQLMNNLFNILNSQKLTCENEFKKAYRGTQEQNQFLGSALEYLQQLAMVDEDGNVIQKRTFVTGFLITMKSLVNLMEDLQKENLKYIFTKHLSKDCMEGFFKRVREQAGASYARPTSIMFARSFKRLFLINLVSNTKKGGTEIDLKSTLAKISDYVKMDIDWKKEDEEHNRGLSIGVIDYQQLWPVPPTDFITGYLLWKCVEKHKCELMVETLCHLYIMEVNADLLLDKFKVYNGANMKKKDLFPLPFFFTNFVERLDRIFKEYSAIHGVSMFGFGRFIYTKMEAETVEMPCECFPLKFMKYLFIRIRIFHMVKEYNMKNKPVRRSRTK